MTPPVRPVDEARRLEALRRYHSGDTVPEHGLDDLAALAGRICDAPIALITLVDERREWFASRIGVPITETPREVSFGGHVIIEPDLLIVPDAARDERFADNPLVTGEPHIRFYAGAPLVTAEGQALGALCVIDRVPRQLTSSQQEALRVLSRQVMAQLELRRQGRMAGAWNRLAAIVESSDDAIIGKDLNSIITSWNGGAQALFGYSAAEMLGTSIMRLIPADRQDEETQILEQITRGERVKHFETLRQTRDGRLIDVSVTVSPIKDAAGKVIGASKVARDISERKRVEEGIREGALQSARAERESRSLFAANPLPMWIYDLTTFRFLDVNDAAIARYGYQRDEFLAMTIKDIRPAEDVERLVATVGQQRDAWQGAGVWRHRLKAGRIIEVDIASHTIEFAGRPAALVVAQDITERTHAQHAQRTSEGRYRTLFEQAPDGIVIADRDSYYLDANASMCRMLGYSRDELIGLHASDIVAPAEVQHIAPALHAIKTTSDYQREWQFRRKDGTFFWADVISTVMPDGNLLAMIRDVTERNHAVEALRAAEERMRVALQNANAGIWEIDYATGLARWSEILEAQCGLPPGTFGGTFEAFVERIHPEDRESVLETLGKAMKSGADFSIQYRTIWPNGTVRWLSGGGRVQLGEHGEPVRAVGISQDVTERRTLEEQFQQAQKMEAIGRLAGGVAHDFNNLLTVILGFCELLVADLDPADPRQAEISEIQKAATSAARLTRQLLAFSRKQIIEPTRLDLNVVVADMRAMLGRLIGEDVTVVLDLAPSLGPVTADRGQVEQIVMNLAVNARDAMPDGGTLTIGTANVELDEHYPDTHFAVKPGPYVVLTVSDTGIGMTPQVQARLFEPFFTTKEVGKGTGLGLATVHGIVTRSGGTVNVYSEVGRGTSFNVYFPRADVAEMAVVETPPPAARPRAAAETVLVVEDEDGLRELIRKLLQRQGYTVLVAANAVEAFRLFEGNASIDVLLTDVVMPGTSGPELTRGLVARRPALKVIYMSGYTEDAIVHHGVLNPGIAFLHKPFTSDALGRKIREVLEK